MFIGRFPCMIWYALKHSAQVVSISITGLLYCLRNDEQDHDLDLALFHAFPG
jgi:hypothetical protein